LLNFVDEGLWLGYEIMNLGGDRRCARVASAGRGERQRIGKVWRAI